MSINPSVSSIFTLDPQIRWTKVLCQFCKQPTGPCSKCYEIPDEDRLAEVISVNNTIVALYSKNCHFRQTNIWKASTNFPVSAQLLRKLEEVPGTDYISASLPYGFTISVAPLFPEDEVKKQLTAAARVFIKEKQALSGLGKALTIRQQVFGLPPATAEISPSGR